MHGVLHLLGYDHENGATRAHGGDRAPRPAGLRHRRSVCPSDFAGRDADAPALTRARIGCQQATFRNNALIHSLPALSGLGNVPMSEDPPSTPATILVRAPDPGAVR